VRQARSPISQKQCAGGRNVQEGSLRSAISGETETIADTLYVGVSRRTAGWVVNHDDGGVLHGVTRLYSLYLCYPQIDLVAVCSMRRQ
jgi:hypothetical protein